MLLQMSGLRVCPTATELATQARERQLGAGAKGGGGGGGSRGGRGVYEGKQGNLHCAISLHCKQMGQWGGDVGRWSEEVALWFHRE